MISVTVVPQTIYPFYNHNLAKKLIQKTLSKFVFGFQYNIHVVCTINRKYKSTSISTHNLYGTLCNKRKPLKYTQFHPYCCCNVTTAWLIHCWQGILCTPHKSLFKKFIMWVDKPQKYNQLFLLNLVPFCVLLAYWLTSSVLSL